MHTVLPCCMASAVCTQRQLAFAPKPMLRIERVSGGASLCDGATRNSKRPCCLCSLIIPCLQSSSRMVSCRLDHVVPCWGDGVCMHAHACALCNLSHHEWQDSHHVFTFSAPLHIQNVDGTPHAQLRAMLWMGRGGSGQGKPPWACKNEHVCAMAWWAPYCSVPLHSLRRQCPSSAHSSHGLCSVPAC